MTSNKIENEDEFVIIDENEVKNNNNYIEIENNPITDLIKQIKEKGIVSSFRGLGVLLIFIAKILGVDLYNYIQVIEMANNAISGNSSTMEYWSWLAGIELPENKGEKEDKGKQADTLHLLVVEAFAKNATAVILYLALLCYTRSNQEQIKLIFSYGRDLVPPSILNYLQVDDLSQIPLYDDEKEPVAEPVIESSWRGYIGSIFG